MGTGVVRRKPTPSALRKKKAHQRIRKQLRRKQEKKRPNWKAAIAKAYADSNSDGNKKGPFGKNKRKRSRNEDGDGDAAVGTDEGGEVQSDVDEEKQDRLNQRDPLETQLFLKRLPLDTTDEELLKFFVSRFGQVRRVLLVRNMATKTLAGTGFVHCGSVELADKIFEHAQQNAREIAAVDRADWKEKTTDLSHCQAKRMRFKLRTDAFVSHDPFLTLRDTRFTVHRVLSRSDSHEASAALQKKQKRTKVAADDPRHLYLLREGLILPDTPAARGLHPQYLAMIQQDYEARKNQLRNSNMFVSTTRLNVRNLPRTMSEKEFRAMFVTQVRSFLKANKQFIDKEKWGKYGPIKNIKLVRDSAGTSKGYAFIEFVNHPIALHALRTINNNPTLFGDGRRLMVSFAIEDINAIQKLQRMREIRRQRQTPCGEVSQN
ncbi:putative RNA-binding protein [Trypanosoma rangeli]|uniref:Putative RNA-binding protein n=1 Tax=Trypanosoma rangeli TaxID=5698 RepID=A0A3R7N0S8_TRYRA|nr:putative RNA-binding protein [Trypanosoma rangeli]RNF10957.1 putative RNA-binding protein [Trypanosoma rangeli]|eukprot:RNF10957.1 putative RNA-binding protein [Trypanosoma rangeli]